MNEKNAYHTFRLFQKTLQPKRNMSYEKNKQEIYTKRVQETNRYIQEKRSEQKHNYEKHTYERYKD